jgi:WD40 repeat protein
MPGGNPEPVTRHLVYEKVVGERGLWIAESDGSDPRLLVLDGERPVISPDGRWVAYTAGKSTYLVPTTGDHPRLISDGIIGGIRWSPDSERIVATGAGATLVSIDVTGRKEEVTLLGHGAISDWSVSPDGTQIVFAATQDRSDKGSGAEESDLFVASLDGGDAKQITDDGISGFPVWGPKSIAFAKLISCLSPAPKEALDGCKNNTWGRYELWQVQPDGSRRRPIIAPLPERFLGQGYIGLVPIDWSADGRALLAGWFNEWGRIPIAVDPQTGYARELAGSDAVALSRDGGLALVESIDNVGSYPKRNTVLIVPYAGGKANVVARGATAASWNR